MALPSPSPSGDSQVCPHCNSTSLMEDPWLGATVCHACGHVAEDGMLQSSVQWEQGAALGALVTDREVGREFWVAGGTLQEDGGTVAQGTGQAERLSAYGIAGRSQALSLLHHLGSILRLRREHQQDTQGILEEALQGQWGQGAWVEVLVPACLYIAIRRARLPVPMVEVAGAAGLPAHQVWMVYRRVLAVLSDSSVPQLEPSTFILRGVTAAPALADWKGEEGQRKLLREATAVHEFAVSRNLHTGRHPLPLAAASVLVAARANGIPVSMDVICAALHAAPYTTKIRCKELWDALLAFAQSMPWGGKVDRSSLNQHLPLILKMLMVTATSKVPDYLPSLPAPAFQAAQGKAASRKERMEQARARLKKSKERWRDWEGRETDGQSPEMSGSKGLCTGLSTADDKTSAELGRVLEGGGVNGLERCGADGVREVEAAQLDCRSSVHADEGRQANPEEVDASYVSQQQHQDRTGGPSSPSRHLDQQDLEMEWLLLRNAREQPMLSGWNRAARAEVTDGRKRRRVPTATAEKSGQI